MRVRDQFARAILTNHFGFKEIIRHSLGEFQGDWENLKALVDNWFDAYKKWEKKDTLVDAYKEQRLTVKGTTTMDTTISAFPRTPDPKKGFYGDAREVNQTSYGPHKLVKTNASIMERLKPEVFKPKAGHSQKTALGYHDLSALLLNPNAPISQQQYKTVQADQVFVFMPLSFAMDQAVFQNINMLGRVFRDTQPGFYDTVRDVRSKMTRIKLLAAHDMATQFLTVGKSQSTGLPKFKYALIGKTDISVRDEDAAVVDADTFKSTLTEIKLEDALKPQHKLNKQNNPTLANYPDLQPTPRTKLLLG